MGNRRFSLGAVSPRAVSERFTAVLGNTSAAARQSLSALGFNSTTSFVAGAMLVGFESTWTQYPPLLVMVPAAIGLRGNVFASLGARLSSAIHTGSFRMTKSLDSVLGRNLVASATLSLIMSTLLGVVGKIIAVTVGIEHSLTVWELVSVSVIGGLLASLVVGAATIALSAGAVRKGWDLDSLVAPTVSTVGDVVTIPALFAASFILPHSGVANALGVLFVLASIVVTIAVFRVADEMIRRIVEESLPVLSFAMFLSALAGLVLQKQVAFLSLVSVILVMQPAFVSTAGSLGSMLAARISTNLHIGVAEPTAVPGREVRRDVMSIASLAIPVTVLNACGAWAVANIAASPATPGLFWVFLCALVATAITMIFVMAVSYYSTIGAWQIHVDPDSFGVPTVTAATDFIGTMSLVLAVTMLQLA